MNPSSFNLPALSFKADNKGWDLGSIKFGVSGFTSGLNMSLDGLVFHIRMIGSWCQ